jgi:hypothetical protein
VSSVAAQTITNGDTIKLKGVTWRLWGIDAPENKQRCGTYPAGASRLPLLSFLDTGVTINARPGSFRIAPEAGRPRAM